MTVSSITRKAGPFDGNGVTTAFPFAFKVFTSADVLVVLTDSNGVESEQTLTTHYTISLNADQNANPGGTITMLSAPATGYKITATSAIGNLQQTDITNGGGFYPQVIEDALDRSTMQIQQLQEAVNRSMVMPLSSDLASFQLAEGATAAGRADRVIGFDASGNPTLHYASGTTQLGIDLASTASGKGAALVGFDGGTLADFMKTKNARVVDSIASLKALDKTKFTRTFVTGYYAAGDGGGGAYWYDSTDTTTADNSGTVIVASDGGRWKLPTGGVFNVRQFGAKGDGTTDDTAAIQAAINTANAANGGAIFLPSGTYKITAALNITGCDNVTVYGVSDDASIIRSTSTTADVFYDSGTSWFRTFRDFSIESTVTRTAGSYFNLAGERRGLFDRVRITGHFNGFNFVGFEQTELRSCSITKPSGAGTGIVCGTAGAAGQGANLLINSCFIRGQNDVTQTDTLGLYGIAIYDVDAVWCVNTDIGAFLTNDVLISPDTRSANHYFTQSFFDATKNSDCVTIQGAGTKQQISFTACWFASAGKLTGGSAEACGVRVYNTGSYQDITFSGCRFYNSSGSGLLSAATNFDANISGCDFYANGVSAVTNRYGFFWSPAGVASIGPNLSGCRFGGSNAPNDIRFDANARNYSVVGCNITAGISNAGTGGILSKNPGYNPVTSTPTVTASPYTYTNRTGDTQTVAVVGGTVSNITLNGVTVGAATNTSISVPNGSDVGVTYTVAPTVYALGT